MVKRMTAINPESFVVAEANMKRPIEPVKSGQISEIELHILSDLIVHGLDLERDHEKLHGSLFR